VHKKQNGGQRKQLQSGWLGKTAKHSYIYFLYWLLSHSRHYNLVNIIHDSVSHFSDITAITLQNIRKRKRTSYLSIIK